MGSLQHIVRLPEVTAGKQVGLVAVIDEGSRLADQPVDDVPVLHLVFASTTQPRQLLDLPLGIPDLDTLGIQAGLDPLPDQTTGHRVDIARYVNDAARVHPHLQPFARLQPPGRQGMQQGHLLGQAGLPRRIGLLQQLPHKRFVGFPRGKIPTAPQHQGLVQQPLELVMALLDVAVLMALPRLDGLGLQTVVVQQSLVTLLEGLGRLDARLHGRREAIGAVPLRCATQLPQGVLQPFAEALQALREAQRRRLPVRVGQDEVIEHVVERDPVDGHTQVRAMGEVAGTQPTGVMHLGEEDLLGEPFQGTPLPAATLQGPQLAIGEAAWETALQVGEDGLSLQPGIEAEQGLDLRPDLGEGIGASPPVPIHACDLTGQPAQPAILAGGLGIHAGLESSSFLADALLLQATQLPYL